ncbi:MAG: LysM peptidoglycan-binding domain-containing protein [Phycisphaerae bacterium]|nr:LysM peptidoglycan-binding domain-containing protein [Phycisphaerae bacterium]
MVQRPEKVAAGLLFLVGLWIAVYWLWEPTRPEISFGNTPGEGAEVETRPAPSPSPLRLDQGLPAPPRKTNSEPPPPTKPVEAETGAAPTPRPTPTPEPAVIAPEFEDYVVQKGDTFAAISTRFFGTPVHAQSIVRANPLMDPLRLRPGRTIRVPKDPANIQGKPVAPPAKGEDGQASVYVVQSGDTLSGISHKLYGSMKHADLIFQANRDRLSSPESIREGQTLNIPPKPKSE